MLLDAGSVAFLNAADAGAPEFASRFAAYASWLERADEAPCPGWDVG